MCVLFLRDFSELAMDLCINRWEHCLEAEVTRRITIKPAQQGRNLAYWCDSEIACEEPVKSLNLRKGSFLLKSLKNQCYFVLTLHDILELHKTVIAHTF